MSKLVYMVVGYDGDSPRFSPEPIEVSDKRFSVLMDRTEFDFIDHAYHVKNGIPYRGKYIEASAFEEHMDMTSPGWRKQVAESLEYEAEELSETEEALITEEKKSTVKKRTAAKRTTTKKA